MKLVVSLAASLLFAPRIDPPVLELNLLPEAVDESRHVRELTAQHLERHELLELGVARAIDGAHRTGADHSDDPIAPRNERLLVGRPTAQPRRWCLHRLREILVGVRAVLAREMAHRVGDQRIAHLRLARISHGGRG